MFIFAVSQNYREINNYNISLENKGKYIFFSVLCYIMSIFLNSFLFASAYFLSKMKKNNEIDEISSHYNFSNLIGAIINKSNHKWYIIAYSFVFIAKRFVNNWRNNAFDVCNSEIRSKLQNLSLFQIKRGVFFNNKTANLIRENTIFLNNNFLKSLYLINNGFVQISINFLLCVGVSIMLISDNNKNKNITLILCILFGVIAVLALLFFIIFKILFRKTPENLYFTNSIGFSRRMNHFSPMALFNKKSYFLFEEFYIFSIFLLVLGVAIPSILYFFTTYAEYETNYGFYLILILLYMFINTDYLKFIFSYFNKRQKNEEIFKNFIIPEPNLEIKGSILLENFPLLKDEEDRSTAIVIDPGKIYEILGETGKTTLIRRIIGLKKRSAKNRSNIKINYGTSEEIENYNYEKIHNSILYINPKEANYNDLTIRDFFKMEDISITDRKIYNSLNKVGLLSKDIALDSFLESLKEKDRFLIEIAKIFAYKKYIFIGEDIDFDNYFSNSLGENQSDSILKELKKNFQIIIFFNKKTSNFPNATKIYISQK